MNKPNITITSDSYKLTHWEQYPETCTAVYSYFESRKGAKYPKTVFVGLQYILKKYFEGVVVTKENIEEGRKLALAHFGTDKHFNAAGWYHILEKHGGKLPVRIKAVPEGLPVDVSNVLLTVENTDPKCFWLTNFLETMLTHIWYPSNVATIGYNMKSVMRKYLEETCENEGVVNGVLPFMLHDFGFRGTETYESAALGGFAHITQFMGTDTIPAMVMAKDYYGASSDFTNIAFSVNATEHSTMTSLGEKGEMIVLDNLLKNYQEGILSVVSDSYDIERFVNVYVANRKHEILNRRPNAAGLCKFVVRPDSLRHENDTPEKQMVYLTESLWNTFGGSVNSKGYKVLNPKIGLLWGDGIGPEGIEKILEAVKTAGYSVEHCVFGMGGGLLQKHNRDTQRSAFKCSAQKHGDEWVEIQKKPLDKTKTSKAGKLQLIKEGEKFVTLTQDVGEGLGDFLETVFEDGVVRKEYTLDQIRNNGTKG